MINIAQVLGRIGTVDTKVTQTGIKVTNMSVVTSKKYIKDGVKEEKVTWHNVVLFNKLADIAEKYMSVGDLVWIQGEMESKKYMTQHGQEKISFKIIANDVKLMPKTKDATATPVAKEFQEQEDDGVPW